MPNYTLDLNADDINNAINRAHSPNTTPTSGVTDKFVTSDGIYQALQGLDLTNFASNAKLTGNATWVSDDAKVATTLATAKAILPTITTFHMHVGQSTTSYTTFNNISGNVEGNRLAQSNYNATGGGAAATLNGTSTVVTVPSTGHTVVEVFYRTRMFSDGSGGSGAFLRFYVDNVQKYYRGTGTDYFHDFFDHFRLDVDQGAELTVSYAGDDDANSSIDVNVINYNCVLP